MPPAPRNCAPPAAVASSAVWRRVGARMRKWRGPVASGCLLVEWVVACHTRTPFRFYSVGDPGSQRQSARQAALWTTVPNCGGRVWRRSIPDRSSPPREGHLATRIVQGYGDGITPSARGAPCRLQHPRVSASDHSLRERGTSQSRTRGEQGTWPASDSIRDIHSFGATPPNRARCTKYSWFPCSPTIDDAQTPTVFRPRS